MPRPRRHYITGGTEYPPLFEVFIDGERLAVYGSYAKALAAFKQSCKARGIRVPKVVLNP